MPFIVVYDANVLYPSLLRNLLIRVAQADLVQAKWTDRIMDEVFRNLKEKRPDLDTAPLDRTRKLMNDAIEDVLIEGYEPLVEILELPDADDRHVLAAAIKAHAQVIVTETSRTSLPVRLIRGTSPRRVRTSSCLNSSTWTGRRFTPPCSGWRTPSRIHP